MNDFIFWFWIYFLALDRLVATGYVQRLFGIRHTYQSITDMIFSLGDYDATVNAIMDVLVVALVAWMLVAIGPKLSSFTFWWAAVVLMMDRALPLPYVSLFFATDYDLQLNLTSFLLIGLMFFVPLLVVAYYITKGLRQAAPRIFWSK